MYSVVAVENSIFGSPIYRKSQTKRMVYRRVTSGIYCSLDAGDGTSILA
nr:MAG TPA: hypothetical protein [Caudoviricetes sp.]